jgi:hypothetical protein
VRPWQPFSVQNEFLAQLLLVLSYRLSCIPVTITVVSLGLGKVVLGFSSKMETILIASFSI